MKLLILVGLISFSEGKEPVKQPTETVLGGYQTNQYKSSLITGQQGGVAAESKVCSELGVSLLEMGGNAVDAAIGSSLCQGVIYPFASGIGGGGFMLIKSANNSTATYIDFRETAPLAATTSMFVGRSNYSSFGGLAIGIPGELKGLEVAHNLYGKLAWKSIFDPVIKLAQSHSAPHQLPLRLKRRQELVRSSQILFEKYSRNGQFVNEGESIQLPELADTLQLVADMGSDAFYKGPLAAKMVQTIKNNGGLITIDDFNNYKVEVGQALNGSYMNNQIHFLPSPASGAVTYHVLKLMEQLSKVEGFSEDVAHYLIEAWKLGFAGRSQLGDPKNDSSIQKFLMNQTEILNNINLIQEKSNIDPQYYYQNLNLVNNNDPSGTSHVNVIDKDGLTVSVTSTINLEFGSKVLCPATGVLFNSQMDDFSTPGQPNFFGLAPSPANFIKPNKRPLSSMSPLIINDHSNTYALGGSGGSRIITALTQVLMNHFHLQLPLNTAINLGRFHHQLDPNQLRLEPNSFTNQLLDQLKSRNHHLVTQTYPESAINVVHRQTSNSGPKFSAVSDIRKHGQAATY